MRALEAYLAALANRTDLRDIYQPIAETAWYQWLALAAHDGEQVLALLGRSLFRPDSKPHLIADADELVAVLDREFGISQPGLEALSPLRVEVPQRLIDVEDHRNPVVGAEREAITTHREEDLPDGADVHAPKRYVRPDGQAVHRTREERDERLSFLKDPSRAEHDHGRHDERDAAHDEAADDCGTHTVVHCTPPGTTPRLRNSRTAGSSEWSRSSAG